jgi:hypothetical protein
VPFPQPVVHELPHRNACGGRAKHINNDPQAVVLDEVRPLQTASHKEREGAKTATQLVVPADLGGHGYEIGYKIHGDCRINEVLPLQSVLQLLQHRSVYKLLL